MVVFTVHEPPSPPADRADRAEALVFVKDGFSWSAAILGPIWLLIQRNWIGVVYYAIAAFVIFGCLYAVGASKVAMTLAGLAINIFLGFESTEIERDHLEAKGWATLGTVSGASLAECERRFFELWLPAQPVIAYHLGPSEQPRADVTLASTLPPAPATERPRGGLLARLGLMR